MPAEAASYSVTDPDMNRNASFTETLEVSVDNVIPTITVGTPYFITKGQMETVAATAVRFGSSEAFAAAVTATNRYTGFAVDIETGEPRLGGPAGIGGGHDRAGQGPQRWRGHGVSRGGGPGVAPARRVRRCGDLSPLVPIPGLGPGDERDPPGPPPGGASAGGGRLSLDPSASAKFFCIAAPGL